LLAEGPFTQEDPIGIAGGLNLYGYANGDPIAFSDPFGLCTNPDTTAEMSYDAYSVVGAEVPMPAEAVSAFFDGARADVADTTRFFVTHWGGVRGIRDALGATTWLSRTEPEHPALVTAVRYPNQRVVSVTYGPGGLPRTVTDDTIQATTTYEWDLKWRRVTSILSPEATTRPRATASGRRSGSIPTSTRPATSTTGSGS
jgi:hypothetical protein